MFRCEASQKSNREADWQYYRFIMKQFLKDMFFRENQFPDENHGWREFPINEEPVL
jgi:hypothetical protein